MNLTQVPEVSTAPIDMPEFTSSELLAIGRLLAALRLGEDTIGEIMKTGGFYFVGNCGTVELAQKIDRLKDLAKPNPQDNKAHEFQIRV